MMHSEKERMVAKLTNPMRTALLTGAGDITRGYGNGRVAGPTNTIVALIDRGLITTGAVHYWTPLGREVARLAFGSGTVRSLDELHAEALDEDTRRFPVSPSEFAGAHRFRDTRGDGRCGFEDCRAGYGSPVHTDRPRFGAEPAKRSGRTGCNCRPHPLFGHEDGCLYAGMSAKPAKREQPQQISQIEAWLKRHGVAIVTAHEVIAARDADHAAAIDENLTKDKLREAAATARRDHVDAIVERYAIRPGLTFRATVVTQAEYGRAYDALMNATGTDVALRAALSALGMSVRQS